MRKAVEALRSVKAFDFARRIDSCGIGCRRDMAPVLIQAHGKGRSLANVLHCSSPGCPRCSGYTWRQRGQKASAKMKARRKDSPSSRWALLTITARHRQGVKWEALYSALRRVWSLFRQTAWARKNLRGYMLAVETTAGGPAGWHVHFHVLAELSEAFDEATFRPWAEGFWASRLRALGRSCEWGERWLVMLGPESLDAAANYVTKAAAEVTSREVKGSVPWEWEPRLFAEYLRAVAGKRLWSTGGTLKLERDSDEEINADRASHGETLAWMSAVEWTNLSRAARQGLQELVYDHETDHLTFARFFLLACANLGVQAHLGSPDDDPRFIRCV